MGCQCICTISCRCADQKALLVQPTSDRCTDNILESKSTLFFVCFRRRDSILRHWNYGGVENFSRSDPLFRNKYSFTIPLLATLSSPVCVKFCALLQADLKGELPFQVGVYCVIRLLETVSRKYVSFDYWFQTKLLGAASTSVKHFVHSTFQQWEHLNEYFLAFMISKVMTRILHQIRFYSYG